MSRSYSDMLKHSTLHGRFEYLKLGGVVGEETFGNERHLNQAFYTSRAWKQARDVAIIRDQGCDLGLQDFRIFDRVIVHHINPVTVKMLNEEDPFLFDAENLICVSPNTHSAIHYGDDSLLPKPMLERKPGDHILWERTW